jgi:uncharacterized protein YqgV (UPF0045/DUF77 family)
MHLSAQISIYPLRQTHIGPAVERVHRALAQHGLEPAVGSMSTLVEGESHALFDAIRQAFEDASAGGDVTMVITVSNACPMPAGDAGAVGDL